MQNHILVLKIKHLTKMNTYLEKYVTHKLHHDETGAHCVLNLIVQECVIHNMNINEIAKTLEAYLQRHNPNHPSNICIQENTINNIESLRAKHFVDNFPIAFDRLMQVFTCRTQETHYKRSRSLHNISQAVKEDREDREGKADKEASMLLVHPHGIRCKPCAAKRMFSCRFLGKNA